MGEQLKKLAADIIAKRKANGGSEKASALGKELLAALKGDDPAKAVETLRNVIRAMDHGDD